jgi:hypothetical protein
MNYEQRNYRPVPNLRNDDAQDLRTMAALSDRFLNSELVGIPTITTIPRYSSGLALDQGRSAAAAVAAAVAIMVLCHCHACLLPHRRCPITHVGFCFFVEFFAISSGGTGLVEEVNPDERPGSQSFIKNQPSASPEEEQPPSQVEEWGDAQATCERPADGWRTRQVDRLVALTQQLRADPEDGDELPKGACALSIQVDNQAGEKTRLLTQGSNA